MKKEDKLLFLAELVGYDVSSFMDEKKNSFKNEGTMKRIGEVLEKENKITTPKYQVLLQEYEGLKNTSIESMEQYVLLTGKANHILSSFLEKTYLNPLFDFEDNGHELSHIIVDFDGKQEFLGDIVLKENYTDLYKIECIKTHVIKWYNEVKDNFIYPLQELIVKPHNLPERKLIPGVKMVYGIFLLIVNIFLIASFFLNDELIYNTLRGDSTSGAFYYPVLIFFNLVLISDVLFVFSILRRYRYVKRYLEGQKMLKNTYYISKKLDKSSELLYKDLLSFVNKKVEVKGTIAKYVNLEIEYKTYLYMKKINSKNSLTKDVFFFYEIIIVQLLFIFIAYFFIYYFVLSGVLS